MAKDACHDEGREHLKMYHGSAIHDEVDTVTFKRVVQRVLSVVPTVQREPRTEAGIPVIHPWNMHSNLFWNQVKRCKTRQNVDQVHVGTSSRYSRASYAAKQVDSDRRQQQLYPSSSDRRGPRLSSTNTFCEGTLLATQFHIGPC